MPQKGYKKDNPVTLFQETFIKEYLVDGNGSKAYIRAGGSPKQARGDASRTLHLPHVKAVIDEALSQRFARLDDHAKQVKLSQQWVIDKLIKNAELAMAAAPLLDRQGNSTDTYRYYSEAANRALEPLGKHLGMFRERVEVRTWDANGDPLADQATRDRILADPAAHAALESLQRKLEALPPDR